MLPSGAYGSTVASYSIESISIKKILSGAVFPVGLILIIIGGGRAVYRELLYCFFPI